MIKPGMFYKMLALIATLPLLVAAALPAIMQDSTTTPASNMPADGFELTGILESINNREVVVDGVVVDIRVAELNTRLTLGDMVRVQGTLIEGVFTAREVNAPAILDSNTSDLIDDDDDNFELRGMVESIGDGFIIVSGQQVEFDDNSNIRVPVSAGQIIRIEGRVIDGVFNVRQIGSPDDDDDNDDNDDDFDSLVIPADCVVNAPAGWVSYTIRPGDTISSIAARSGGRVTELTRVNCLINPRFIVAGTPLFVPRIPSAFPNRGSGNESSRSINNNNQGNESSGSNRQAPPPPPTPRNRGGNESSGSNSGSNSSS